MDGIWFVALHNHMKAGPSWGIFEGYIESLFSAILVICELYDFALLMSLTTFPTTNLFLFPVPISAFSNGFWLYFWWLYQIFRRYIDSELKSGTIFFLWCCLYTQVEFWTWVNPFLKYSYYTHHKVCNLLALIFLCVDILFISVCAVSLLVESCHRSSLASLSIIALAQRTFYKMTPFMVRGKSYMANFWWLRFPTLNFSMLARDRLKVFQ